MATTERELKDNAPKRPVQFVLVLSVTLASESQGTLLSALATAAGFDVPTDPVGSRGVLQEQDPWLALRDAAQYIGLSTSTLYKYASQRKIEFRKLAGRLQFRRSVLDRFLAQQIRPARSAALTRSIMHPALGSGK